MFSNDPHSPLRAHAPDRHGVLRCLALSCALLGLTACSSPTAEANRHYEAGMALLRKGSEADIRQADQAFRDALAIRKTMAPAIHGLARVAEKQGNLQRQFSYLSQAVAQDPTLHEAQVELGKLLLAAGQIDKAQLAADKALSVKPDDPAARVLRAAILHRKGNRAAATREAEAVLKTHADNADALAFLARERLESGDAGTALHHLDKALLTDAQNLTLLTLKVDALERLGRTDAAEATLRGLIARHPENASYRHVLVRFLITHGRKAPAEAELRQIASGNPGNIGAKLDVIRFIQATQGLTAARQELEAMLRKEPRNNTLRFALAGILQDANDGAAAERLVREIMAGEGDTQDGLRAKGLLAAHMLRDGRKDSAMRLVDEVLAKDRRNAQALLLKATMAIDGNRLEQAVTDLRTVLHDDPDSARALVLLARAHELQGSPDLAGDHYAQAYQRSGMDVSYGMAYAEFLMRRGQAERAEKLLSGILEKRPGLIPVLNLLAQARSSQGDWAGVRQAVAEMRRLGG